jgi:hypothetical protein
MAPEARSLLVFTSGGPRNMSVHVGPRSPRPKEVDFAYVCIVFLGKMRKVTERGWKWMEMDGNGWKEKTKVWICRDQVSQGKQRSQRSRLSSHKY